MDDLVKRLRDRGVCSLAHNSCRNDVVCEQAADRIEELEAKLVKAADALDNAKGYVEGMLEDGCPRCGGDCSSAMPPVAYCPMQIMQSDLDFCKASIEELKGAKP